MDEDIDYREPERTEWGGFALLSEVDEDDSNLPDPDDYYDIHGYVQDEENWRALQGKILEEGTYEERPEKAPFDGAKYHATDINVIFSWDDDAGEWTPLNTGSSDNPVPGTTHLESVSSDEASIGEGIELEDDYVLDLEDTDTEYRFGADGTFQAHAIETETSDSGGVSVIVPEHTTVPGNDSNHEFPIVTDNNGFDTFGAWDNSTHQFEAPGDGIYHITVNLMWDNITSAGELRIEGQLNDSPARARLSVRETVDDLGGNRHFMTGSAVYQLSEGDVWEVFARNDTGEDAEIDSQGDASHVDIIRVA